MEGCSIFFFFIFIICHRSNSTKDSSNTAKERFYERTNLQNAIHSTFERQRRACLENTVNHKGKGFQRKPQELAGTGTARSLMILKDEFSDYLN